MAIDISSNETSTVQQEVSQEVDATVTVAKRTDTMSKQNTNTLLESSVLDQTIANAQAIIITAHFLYHISVVYHPLDDGTYEVLPVGDNDFTTIVSSNRLAEAILSQITCFMESPVFIEQQLARLTALS